MHCTVANTFFDIFKLSLISKGPKDKKKNPGEEDVTLLSKGNRLCTF